ncbi:MAG TPA: acetolactate synthase small subunit [Candidatus Latescibacteria bacterium]|nr:acetolactate synthase small subunit [Candidatus Latescibacterota bacterium]
MNRRHIISVLVENHFGVLARISSLIAGRGFNIDSLTVGETEDPTVSRMTIVTRGDEQIIEQITKQLNRLIDVIKVTDMTECAHVERELVLIKVAAPTAQTRTEVVQVVDVFRARVVDMSTATLTIEITGDSEKVDAFIEMIEPFGIKEMARTGSVAMGRERNGKSSRGVEAKVA